MTHSAENDRTVFVLPSIHHVLRAEKELKKAGADFDLIPVPKEVNPDCGMAVETPAHSSIRVRQVLKKAALPIEAVYLRRDNDFRLMEQGPQSN